jgi:transposase
LIGADFCHAEGWARIGGGGAFRTDIDLQAFVRTSSCAASSASRTCASLVCIGAQKNCLRLLRTSAEGLVRSAVRQVRDLSSGGNRILLELEVRRLDCRNCGGVKRERLDFLADNPHFTRRFAYEVGRRCREASIRDVARDFGLDWDTVKTLDIVHAGRARACRHAGAARDRDRRDLDPQGPQLSHRGLRPGSPAGIWFGGMDRSEASMAQFYDWLGSRKSAKVQLAVMDMWKPFRTVASQRAPQVAVLFDKFHIMRHLGEALDKVRKAEYARVSSKDRRFIKGQKYTLLSHLENLSLYGKRSLGLLLAANKRLNTAYLLKEVFGQLWSYRREGWARRFFDNWRASLKWQRLASYEKFAAMIDRHWDGIAAYCKPENKISLGFVEGLNNKIRLFQRRAYGLRDEEYLRLKVLTCMLPRH